MATHARQQYFADENSLSKERREFSIADDIQEKIDSVEEGAQVNKIETVKVNGTALVPDVAKAVNVEVPDVIDNLYTVAADDALSAKQGKILYDYIQNLQTIGRFLSNWDSATGLPITNPSESPYLYKAGDYYRVSNVAASPATNYKPDGSSYTIGVASTTVETLAVAVSDLYLYDGTDWILLSNSGSSIAVDSSLSTTSTNPVENRVITNAINGKHPGTISNVTPSNPVEGMLWYDTTTDTMKVYDGTAWQSVGGGDVLVSDQANNIFTPGMKIWGGTESDYQSLTPDSNTAYLLLAGGPTPGGWQPGVNTVAYYPLDTDFNDASNNSYDLTNVGGVITTLDGVACAYYDWASYSRNIVFSIGAIRTISVWVYVTSTNAAMGAVCTGDDYATNIFGIFVNGGYGALGDWRGAIQPGTTSILNGWHLLTGVLPLDGQVTLYIDGNFEKSYTFQIVGGGEICIGAKTGNLSEKYTGYVSKVIVEDKARTAPEVSAYYDLTKGDYGIS